jgi:hypothetical protein
MADFIEKVQAHKADSARNQRQPFTKTLIALKSDFGERQAIERA